MSILDIAQDAQNTVRLSTLSLETLHELQLDTLTYTVYDNAGNQVAQFEGRENQEAAHDAASLADELQPSKAPHWVEQTSNLSIDENGKLDFEIGSKVGIVFPTEEINLAAEELRNAVDCETIQQLINQEIDALKDLLKAKMEDMNLMGGKSDIMKLPSNPLKILSWAKKFVSKILGPQLLAMVDLAIQIGQFASAVQDIIIAAQAAQQNLLLCARSVVDDTLDKVIDDATTILEDTFPQIDKALGKISEIQDEIVGITGATPVFNVTSIDNLVQSATADKKAEFVSQIDAYVTAPFDDAPLAQETVQQLSTDLSGSASFATGTLASAGALAAETSFTVDGTTFTFENGVLKATS